MLSYFGWIYEKGPFDSISKDLSELENVPLDGGALLSNSGLTKIYSVIGDRCVIYDNRVAASLGKIITEYLAGDPLCAELSIVVGPKPRDPSTLLHRFPKKGRRDVNVLSHAKSNLAANWLISAVVDLLLENSPRFKKEVNKQLDACCRGLDVTRHEKWMAMRIYEAGLFMAGHTV